MGFLASLEIRRRKKTKRGKGVNNVIMALATTDAHDKIGHQRDQPVLILEHYMNSDTIKEGKTTALVAYFTLLGALIAISMNSEPKNEFARFHTRQAFGLHLFFLGFALFLSVWFNAYAFYGLYIGYIVLWGFGFIGALQEKKQSVPLLGDLFQKWFTFIR